MCTKRASILGIVLGLMAILSMPASANVLKSATATANCQGYSLTAVAGDLVPNKTYTITYNFSLTCNGGLPVNVPGSIVFKATASSMTVTTSGTFPGLAGSCVVTGTAALQVGLAKQIPIIINGVKSAPLSCSLPTANCAVIVAEQGVPITPVTLTASGGAGGPYTFTATGLPAGLSISTSGTISGTPTVSGTFPYTVTITDVNGNKGSISCSVTVNPPPQLTCSATNSGEVGVPFNSGPITVTGATSPYTFSIGSGTLPAGLTLNTSTGAVTGTPTAAGTFTIKVTDSLGATATGTCSITIVGPPQVTCSATNSGEVGVPFNSGPITVTGGTSPYTFSIGSGTLPAGLTLNTSTGAVTGTPTASGTLTIKVTEGNGVVGSGTCAITIVGPPQVTCSATNSGEVGVPFNSGPITVTGGTSPYTFSIGSGTLPAGLTLNTSTGAVTGTPTASGTFTIKVTDANGVVGTGTCAITIVGGPQVTCSATNTGEVGVPFNSGPITVTGGTSPYTFSIGSGSLPPGLTLNTSTGAVTGTPTAAGTFTIKVTDADGVVGNGTCSITINTPPCLTSQLGPAGDFSVLGLYIDLDGNLQIGGNVGIGTNGKIDVADHDQFPGTLFADPTANISFGYHSGFTGGVTTESFTAIQNAVMAEAAFVASLTPTQTFSQITSAITITGNGGQNVIQVNGPVNLSNGHNLTISGGPNDTFFFNISGGFFLNGANVVLNGVTANQVMFFFPGSGDPIQVSNGNTNGIFLALQRTITIQGGTHVSEFISGAEIELGASQSCGNNNPTVIKPLPVCSPEQINLSCPANAGIVGIPYKIGRAT